MVILFTHLQCLIKLVCFFSSSDHPPSLTSASLTGGLGDRVGLLRHPVYQFPEASCPLVLTHVLLQLQKESAERTDGVPEAGLLGALLLHLLPGHRPAQSEESQRHLLQLPKVSAAEQRSCLSCLLLFSSFVLTSERRPFSQGGPPTSGHHPVPRR